jgi:hypothetical protein
MANQTLLWCSANSSAGLYIHYWSVPINTGPPPAAKCTADKLSDIAFGTVDPSAIAGKKAAGVVIVRCDKKASTRIRFMTREGADKFLMDNGLIADLKVDGYAGAAGSYQTVAENASYPGRVFNLSAELVGTTGSVKPGAFSYTAVVRVDIL